MQMQLIRSNLKWISKRAKERLHFHPKFLTNHPLSAKILCLHRTTNYRYHTSRKTPTQRLHLSHLSAVIQKGVAVTTISDSLAPPHPPTGNKGVIADLQPNSKSRVRSGGKKWTIWLTCLIATFRAKRSNKVVNWNLLRRSLEKSEKAFLMVSNKTNSLIKHKRMVADLKKMDHYLAQNSWTDSNFKSKECRMRSVFLKHQRKGKNI